MSKLTKRLLIVLLVIMQLIFLWVPVELRTLYNTRLGFMRQILFMNETYPVHLVEWLFWLLVLLTLYYLITLSLKRHKKWQIISWLSVGWLLLVLLVIIIAALLTAAGAPLHFYNLACWCVVLIMQLLMIKVAL
ncbi:MULTISPECIES: hypothetical protein [Loigolactobacillus]|uniref:Uncharacterized protein n=1 Tax=Loigolactobacillus backii TaxID=375175 RepID=A0A192H178_9LACO|nr:MULTISPECIES: hypothetical protein [Loigolactobacillus]ANK61997.1 hypothetical protein AYR53_03960 [Loigolactobacillus backii]ANK65386.1 hypothetical protein AYR54_09155 [Loigolactobacillus backii]ANK67936.1 hypothetical protein AYR55_09700 [Loigolactobacillus backii]ANK68809.1 hypothetical protein AYR56_00765 [Loigolactobacillus backii]MDA5386807.1 hypothetical protein [Loigolactobacillus backii]